MNRKQRNQQIERSEVTTRMLEANSRNLLEANSGNWHTRCALDWVAERNSYVEMWEVTIRMLEANSKEESR